MALFANRLATDDATPCHRSEWSTTTVHSIVDYDQVGVCDGYGGGGGGYLFIFLIVIFLFISPFLRIHTDLDTHTRAQTHANTHTQIRSTKIND